MFLVKLILEMKKIFQNLCDFSNGSILRNGIAMFFANYFDLQEEKKKFQKYFKLLDKDRNGLISFEELVDALAFKVKLIYRFFNYSFLEQNLLSKFQKFTSLLVGNLKNLFHFWNFFRQI